MSKGEQHIQKSRKKSKNKYDFVKFFDSVGRGGNNLYRGRLHGGVLPLI